MHPEISPPKLPYCFDRIAFSYRADKAKGIEGCIQFDVTEGDARDTWYLSVSEGECVATREARTSDAKITITKELFVDGILGKADMEQAFLARSFNIEGNIGLAMSINSLFDRPKPYDAWFYALEQCHLQEKSAGKEIVYRFTILDSDPEGSAPLTNGEKITFRNIMIKNGSCAVYPLETSNFDVEFIFTEKAIMKMADGSKSYYDLFLLGEFDFHGDNGDVFDFPSYFMPETFPNRKVTEMTVARIFAQMPKMIGKIPQKLQDKIICMNIIGSDSGMYFIRVQSESIMLIPKDEVERISAKITMPTKIFFDFCYNELDYHSALDESLIHFQGDVNVGMTFDTVFKYRFTRDTAREDA